MTQAIALERILAKAGHELVGVLLGTEKPDDVPSRLTNQINARVETFQSPTFEVTRDAQSIAWIRSAIKTGFLLPRYLASVNQIINTIDRLQPDLVVNFFEPLTGLAMIRRRRIPCIAVAHQYMFLHPRYASGEGGLFERVFMKLYTQLTSVGANRRLALSLYPAETLDRYRLRVVPPLLRDELFSLGPSTDESFILVYSWTAEVVSQILDWHETHPDVRLECFIPDSGFTYIRPHAETLTFYRLHETLFLERMNACSGVVTTAGFETPSEAFYLGKPLLMVPTHFEQYCNAKDASFIGAGSFTTKFDLDDLACHAAPSRPANTSFRVWVSRASEIFLNEVHSLVVDGRVPKHSEEGLNRASQEPNRAQPVELDIT